MANTIPGLETIATPEADDAAIAVKAPTVKGMPTIAGNLAFDPTETQNILQQMQKLVDERSGPYSQIMGGLKDAAAWTSGGARGPSAALNERDREKSMQQKELSDMQTQMALYRSAQTQAQNDAARYGSVTPGAGSTGASSGAVVDPDTGITIPPEQLQREYLAGPQGRTAARQEYLKTAATERTKKQFSPAMSNVVDIFVPGEGMQQMTTAQAEKFLSKTPGLQAVVNGQKVPAAQAIAQANAPSFSDPSISIISGQRTPQKGQELWDQSVANGTPGKLPNGNPVAKPGESEHEKEPGSAYDIDSKKLTKSGRAELAQKGYYQPLGVDSNHWERIPGQAPAQPAQQPTESRAQYDRRIAEEKEIGSSRIKEGEVKRNDVLQARESSIETGNAIGRIESTLNTPEGVKAVGQFSKPGVVSAFGIILSEGIQAGNFGSVSFKGLGDAVRAAGGDQKTIDAAQRLARDFAQMQLNIAKRDLKGQGAVSDNERRIVEHVTGSTSNSPEVLKNFTRWNRVRNTFDKDVGDALQKWEETHPNQSYTKFKESTEYKNLENSYITKTDEMANKMGISGKASPKTEGGDKTDEYLKKYKKKAD
jgi:hypothetical protein